MDYIFAKLGLESLSIFTELSLESLSTTRLYQKLLFLHNSTRPFSRLPERGVAKARSLSQRHLKGPICRTESFWSSFFLPTLKYGTFLILICKIYSYKELKQVKYHHLLNTKSNSVFSVHDVYGVKLLSRLGLNFGDLNEHNAR